MEEYKIGRFTFSSLEEYNLAKREIAIIKKLKDKSDLTDPQIIDAILTSFVPQTTIGETFVNNLRNGIPKEDVQQQKEKDSIINSTSEIFPNKQQDDKPATEVPQRQSVMVDKPEPRSISRDREPVREERVIESPTRTAERRRTADDVNIDMAEVTKIARQHPTYKNYSRKGLTFIGVLVVALFVIGELVDNIDINISLTAYLIVVGLLVTYSIYFAYKLKVLLKHTQKIIIAEIKKDPEKYKAKEPISTDTASAPTANNSSEVALKVLGAMARIATDYAVGSAAINATRGITESIIPPSNPNTARYQQAHDRAVASARSLSQTTRQVGKYEVTTLHNGKQIARQGVEKVGTYDKFKDVTYDRFGHEVGKGNQLDKLMR